MYELIEFTKEIRRKLHKIPEPAFKEFKTTKFIEITIRNMGLQFEKFENLLTGGYCKIGNQDNVVLYRTDIDGLPIQESRSNKLKSTHHGYMHACGHDYHTAFGLALLRYFKDKNLKRGLNVIFQPAEESADSGGMYTVKEIDFSKVCCVLGVHMSPYYEKGVIQVKSGPMCASSSLIAFEFKGKGGHTSAPDKSNDLVYIVSEFISHLNDYLRKQIDQEEIFILSFGKIQGGESHNIIPEKVFVGGSLRVLNENVYNKIKDLIKDYVKGYEKLYKIKIDFKIPSYCPPVINNNNLYNNFVRFISQDKELKETWKIENKVFMGADDFSFYSRIVPGLYFLIGAKKRGELHSPILEFDEDVIDISLPLLTRFVEYLLKK
ncbi:MAG: amidohydrolase [Candidatus Marinimicrobia bacterium]|nr:amidohydrolase [Candidatus Neomarinimicrobiota bacterium]